MDIRKKTICKVCLEEKGHHGLGMCSACLRKHKRRTRPIYYLRTCYSEIKRRCTSIHKTRKNKYFGMNYPTKEVFVNRFLTDKDFLDQYKIWQDNDFKRGFAPSIDRMDNDGDYDISNLRFIDNRTNGMKDCKTHVGLYKNDILLCTYESINDAARNFDCNPGTVHRSIYQNYKVRGHNFKEIK